MSISKIEEINKNITKILSRLWVNLYGDEKPKFPIDDRSMAFIESEKEIHQQILSLIEELEGKLPNQQVNSLCNSVIMVANKFIQKCKDGRARSVETLSDMLKIKQEAEMLKKTVNYE